MPRLAQPWRRFPPNHTAGPAAMHQDERHHSFLPSKNGTSLVNVSLEETVPLLPALACWSKIGIDRAPEEAVVRTLPTPCLECSNLG